MTTRIVFHGTPYLEVAKQIQKEGFKKGTYFARHLEDSLEFGGKYIFYVALEVNTKNWQIVTEEDVLPERITRLITVNPKILFEGDGGKFFPKGEPCPCPKCGTDIGSVPLSIFGKKTTPLCPSCKTLFKDFNSQ